MANIKTSIHNNNRGRPSRFSKRFYNSKKRSNYKGNNVNNVNSFKNSSNSNNSSNLNNSNNLNNNARNPKNEIVVESGYISVSALPAGATLQNTNETINANPNIIAPKRKPQINTRPDSKILNQTNIQDYIDLSVKNLPRKYRNEFLDEEILEPTSEEMETSEQEAAQKKKNKRKKPVDPVKVEFNKKFLKIDEIIHLISNRKVKLLSIDMEWHEYSNKLTEVGFSFYDPTYQKLSIMPHIVSHHIIIEETQYSNNENHVPNNKKNFIGCGPSFIVKKSNAGRTMKSILNNILSIESSITNEKLPVCFVGHNPIADFMELKDLGVNLLDYENVSFIDTQNLWLSMHESITKSSLTFVLNKLNIPHSFLHNAANDSYYTLLVCLMLGSAESRYNLINELDGSIRGCHLNDKTIVNNFQYKYGTRPTNNNFYRPQYSDGSEIVEVVKNTVK
ncbi:hypothetical protein B5S33_g4190 [[Candida] boidinii]|nr:hypothetical protein B5S33_g4190 [[Candida] boidinii]